MSDRLQEILAHANSNTGPKFGYTHQLCQNVRELVAMLDRPVCKWTLITNHMRRTDCGKIGRPSKHQKFCGYCGGKLEEVIPAEDDDEQ